MTTAGAVAAQIEAEVRMVRSFITKDERPDVGGPLPDAVPEGELVEPERLPADPDAIVPSVETDQGDGAKKAPSARKAGGTRKARGTK